MRKKKGYLKYLLLILVLLMLITSAYAYLSGKLNINGKISGKNDGYVIDNGSNSQLNMKIISINSWVSGNLNYYQYSIDVTNTKEDIDNFKLYLNFNNDISNINIWNNDYELNGKQLIIINNNKIGSNETKQMQFIISSSFILKLNIIKFEVEEGLNEITSYDLNFQISNSWGSYYYQYNVTLTNKGDKKINSWKVEITLPENTFYVSGWSALFKTEGNKLIISNEDYNGKIEINKSIVFGLQLNTNQNSFIPNNIRVFGR